MEFPVSTSKHRCANPMGLCIDNDMLYIISSSSQSQLSYISIFDINSLTLLNEWEIDNQISLLSTVSIDGDSMYLPLKSGSILKLDKQTGNVKFCIDVNKSIITSNLKIHNDKLYYLSGVPITNGVKLYNNLFSVQSRNCITGQQEKQTCFIQGHPCYGAVYDKIWVTSQDYLYIFNLDCALEYKCEINTPSSFQPEITENFVTVISKNGFLQIFSKYLLHNHGNLFIENINICAPGQDDYLYLFLDDKMLTVDLNTLISHDISKKIHQKTIFAKMVRKDLVIFASEHATSLYKDKTIIDKFICDDRILLYAEHFGSLFCITHDKIIKIAYDT